MAVLLKSLLSNIINPNQKDWRIYLLKNWNDIIGPLKTRICLESIYNDTLVIGVYESHWMQELFLLSKVLLNSINKHLDEPRINQVRFKLIEVKKPKESIKKLTIKNEDLSVQFTKEQKSALIYIQDEQLRLELTRFWQRCTREN